MKRRIVHGIEEATLDISHHLLGSLSSRPEEILAPTFAAQYNAEPRPSATDILNVELGLPSPIRSYQEVRLRIARGHYALAQILLAHDAIEINKTEGMYVIGCGKTSYFLLPSSLPRYDTRFILPNAEPVESYHYLEQNDSDDLDSK